MRVGSFEVLAEKARPLFGGREQTLPAPVGQHPIIYFLIGARQVDVFFVYCANAGPMQAAEPQLRVVPLPPELDVTATFGLTVMSQEIADVSRLALTILSLDGQRILARHGFDAPLVGQREPPDLLSAGTATEDRRTGPANRAPPERGRCDRSA
ncbi:MAG: substrate-binding domain-containing protein [Chloroflexota bacterium]|nr:substrate-binding domain-containing protein [Chloroflexota bacterium]